MDSVKFFLDINYGDYSDTDASSIKMEILGCFLASDVSSRPASFKEYALNDWEKYTSSNATGLEKENGHILLRDLYSEEKIPTKLKMSLDQFIKLLDDWEEKVCKLKPKEVTITYDNDKFVIETKN